MKRQMAFASSIVLALAAGTVSFGTVANAAGRGHSTDHGEHHGRRGEQSSGPSDPGGGGADTVDSGTYHNYCGPIQWTFGRCE